MKIYLVGGAVRDQLLGRPIKEKDWVVVGATAEDMLQQGFRQVGKDFPVFLHPETHEEYALARNERKIRPGYTGFEFDASPSVSLEEDLKRRDITINAMAETPDGQIIDPYHGQRDLAAHLLRHVSDAFVEDPVRILRIARFAARLNFTVAPETLTLMRKMVASGEVNALVAERVWKELERALVEPYPEQFFEVLYECGALSILFPEIALEKSRNTLQKAAKNELSAPIRFACLLQDLPELKRKALCDRYKVPTYFRDIAHLANHFFNTYKNANNAPDILSLLESVDAFRREERLKEIIAVWQLYDSTTSKSAWLYACYQAIKARPVPPETFEGTARNQIPEKIKEIRKATIEDYLKRHPPTA